MLGVTLFGILLTPVFFVLVDWVADTKLFRSRTVRFIARVLIDIMTLGVLRLVMVMASRRNRRRLAKEAKPILADADLDVAGTDAVVVGANVAGGAVAPDSEHELAVVGVAEGHANGHANGHGNGHAKGDGNGHAYEAVAVASPETNGHSNGNGHSHGNGHPTTNPKVRAALTPYNDSGRAGGVCPLSGRGGNERIWGSRPPLARR